MRAQGALTPYRAKRLDTSSPVSHRRSRWTGGPTVPHQLPAPNAPRGERPTTLPTRPTGNPVTTLSDEEPVGAAPAVEGPPSIRGRARSRQVKFMMHVYAA